MYSPISTMPDDSRVWVYQADRELNEQEREIISVKTQEFLDSWTSHNLHLKASFEIRHNLFLILMIDEKAAEAGGCSIDKSVHFIKQLELEHNLQLMNRFLFAYKNNGHVEIVSRENFQDLVKSGKINDNTIVYNNLVKNKFELVGRWEIPFKTSWHKSII